MMLEAEQRGVAMGAKLSHFLFSGWKASTVSSMEGWWPTVEQTHNKNNIQAYSSWWMCSQYKWCFFFFFKHTQSTSNNHSSSYDGCHKVCPLRLHGNDLFRLQPRSCSEYLHIHLLKTSLIDMLFYFHFFVFFPVLPVMLFDYLQKELQWGFISASSLPTENDAAVL